MKRRAEVMFFWDYDGQWGAERSRRGVQTWGMDEFKNTERILGLLGDRKIPAVFACVGAIALPGERPYHDAAQIRAIHDDGHEVASHSFRHEWLPELEPSALRESLVRSREALEECIGSRVTTFVPPWNQPYDLLSVGSISLSERRSVQGPRTDVLGLCDALRQSGYSFARLAFRNGGRRVMEAITRRDWSVPTRPRELRGVSYVLLNTPAGFDDPARRMVRRVCQQGGIAVLWGHPHSLTADNAQSERYLVPLLDYLAELRESGLISFVLPRALV